jgi:hypothetical protein
MKTFKTYIKEVNGGPIVNDPTPTPTSNNDDVVNKAEKGNKETKKGGKDKFEPEPTLTPIVTRG